MDSSPTDPLIGTWERASTKGEPFTSPRWIFGGDGTYRRETVEVRPEGNVVVILEHGAWARVDADTIARYKYPYTELVNSQVRIEDDGMLIDEQVAVDAAWKWTSESYCTQHGQMIRTRSWLQLRPDGSAELGSEFCNGLPGGTPGGTTLCYGTWAARPLGITVTLQGTMCKPTPPATTVVIELFRAEDMTSRDGGFLRASEP